MSMSNQRVINRKLAATSIVRPIEAIKPPEPTQTKNVILKPKPPPNKNLPGTKLLIKLAKDREKQKEREKMKIMRDDEMNQETLNQVIDDIIDDLI